MNPLERVQLGRTEIDVTRLGLGTAPLGGWPTAVSRPQALATVQRAWDAGIRYFDTAPFYGHGLSETHVGMALADRPRPAFVLSTKVGRMLVPGDPSASLFEGVPPLVPEFDFSYKGALRSLEGSHARLGLTRIDIALIHDPDDHHRAALDGAYRALLELRASGSIGAIGVGMNWSEPLAQFAREADFDCLLVAGRYTLLEQGSLDDLLPACLERGISLIAGGVLNSGLLARPVAGATYNYAPAAPDVLRRAQELEAVCAEFDVPIRAAALQFPLAHPAVASIVVGSRSPDEVDDTIAMLRLELPPQLWAELKHRGLVRADAPTPMDATDGPTHPG